MPYQEVHFNTAVFGDKISYAGTRDRRVLELNDPIHLDKFHVRDLELPLTWDNVNGGTLTWKLEYSNLAFTYNYTAAFPTGSYTGSSFAAQLQTLLQTTVATNDDANRPDTTLITVGTDVSGYLFITVPVGVHTAATLAAHTSFVQFCVTWPNEMKKYFSRTNGDVNLTICTPGTTVASLYQLRLIPNYLYLHSNLMTATPYGSAARALGSFASRTILTKIQLDPGYVWGQIQPWTNPALEGDFMFLAGGQETNRLEFWFTDEDNKLINFNNINFSLTLACFYH